MSSLDVNAEQLAGILESADKPVVIDFWAPWCAPCRAMAPYLEAYAEANTSKVTVVKINVDDNPELTDTYSIQSIPTLVAIKDGKVVHTQSGSGGEAHIESFMRSALDS